MKPSKARRFVRRRSALDAFAAEPYGTARGDRSYEIITFDGATLPVEETGPAAATTGAVFVHGLSVDHTIWHHQMLGLDRDRRYLFFDLRGHGQATAGDAPLQVETFARDLEVVLEVSGLERAVLVGHSLGGIGVLQFAAQDTKLGDRVRGLALLSATGGDVVQTFVAGAMLGPLPVRRRIARWLFANPEILAPVRVGECGDS